MTIFNRWRDRVNRTTQTPVTAEVRVAALTEALDTLHPVVDPQQEPFKLCVFRL